MAFQLGAEMLDACVLGILVRGDAYGYSLTQEMTRTVNISESTLYPVLRRLQKDGSLTTYDKPVSGRIRRYYAITDLGREKYGGYRREWIRFRASVDNLLGGTENEE